MGFDPSAILALLTGTVLIVVIIVIIVGLLLRLLFLKIGIKAVKGKNTDTGSIFVTWLLMILCNLVPCIACILHWVVINNRHKTGFGKAIGAWLIAGLLPALIIGVISAILMVVGIFPSWAEIMALFP